VKLHFVLAHLAGIEADLRGGKSDLLNEDEVRLVAELAGEPEERLLKVVVALGRQVIILEALLTVEGDLLGFHFTVTNINLVSNKDDRDGLADANKILVPVGDMLVRLTVGNIEHDDSSISEDVVSITKTPEFLLSGSIPTIETNHTTVRLEIKRMDLNTQSGNVLLFEFASQMAFHETSFTDTTITNKDELEFFLWGMELLTWVRHLSKINETRNVREKKRMPKNDCFGFVTPLFPTSAKNR
jgi:hypothetical protein